MGQPILNLLHEESRRFWEERGCAPHVVGMNMETIRRITMELDHPIQKYMLSSVHGMQVFHNEKMRNNEFDFGGIRR